MPQTLALTHWESHLEAENAGACGYGNDVDKWNPVTVPHNWQDYHGYRAISHGDLHGRAFYRTEVGAGALQLEEDNRVLLHFEAVAGTATVEVNGRPAGHHVGGLVGFELDITDCWKVGSSNRIEVISDFKSGDHKQPFFCGGCLGSPFSEGPQPKGICRPVWLKVVGPACFEKDGIYLWCEEASPEQAEPNLRYELANPSNRAVEATLTCRLLDPDGAQVMHTSQAVGLQAGKTLRQDITLPTIDRPRLWSPDKPQLYRLLAELRGPDGSLWDLKHEPFGIRQLHWPTIAEPDADHDVRSTDSRGKCVDDGLAEASDENYFYNELLTGTKSPHAGLVPGSVRIRGEWDKHQASLSIAAETDTMDSAGSFRIAGEITNDLGTVFYHQFTAGPHEFPVDFTLNDPQAWTWDRPFLYRLTLALLDAESGEKIQKLQVRFALKDGRNPLNIGKPKYEETGPEQHPVDALPDDEKVFRVNGQPLFLHGSCAYETQLGKDYAWEERQVESFCARFKAAGFNAFRDGHLPHHLHTYDEWDRLGILCWTQLGSHLYFDNPDFRENFKTALRTWVRERRNHPSIFAWGLQNESILPEAFARELCDIIREEDPTASRQRLITTCNGGKGTDWNVPQEWSGTYGGNCHDSDVERAQLIGEYGSWRLIGNHEDRDYSGDENDFSESWANYSLGVKLQRAIERKDRAMGMFQWAFTSFPNPGRSVDRMEGTGNLAIAPINCKGLLTAWMQPTDAYYLYQSALTDPANAPMVYIVSHTWPDRWAEPGTKDRILVYSNCEEVELFNDVGRESLGILKNPGPGRPFRWDEALIRYGLLYAEGRVGGKTVARDIIRQPALPEAPHLRNWTDPADNDPADLPATAIRLNCGGPEYRDQHGNLWQADKPWQNGGKIGSLSWGDDYALDDPALASFGSTSDPVRGTREQALYQTFRYGLHRLRFRFDLVPGAYQVHLGLVEPWNGIGCQQIDCTGWRLFDLAINGTTLLEDIDPWATGGTLSATRVTTEYTHAGETMELHFPRVASGQAIIAWIAIEPISSKL